MVTRQTITNWRERFATIPLEHQLGSDLFIQKCMDTIDVLQSRITELEAENTRLQRIETMALEQSEDVQLNWASPYEKVGMENKIKKLEVKLAEANEDAENLMNYIKSQKADLSYIGVYPDDLEMQHRHRVEVEG